MKILLPSNKKFGLFFSFLFFLLSVYFFFKNNLSFTLIALSLCLIFVFISIFFSNYLKILNFLWIKLGLFLGSLIAPIILFLIFFFIFVPIGFILRIFGIDILRLKNKRKSSYWIKRKDKIRSMEELF